MFDTLKKEAFKKPSSQISKVLQELKNHNFNNASTNQQLMLTLSVVNATAATLTAEFFSYIDSIVRRKKAEYVSGAFLYTPISSVEGLVRAIADTGGTVAFDQDGNLEVLGANNAAARLTISCSNVSYAGLFEASAVIPFRVEYLRMTVTTDGQIDNDITYFSKSFSGGQKEITIPVRSYFRPNQQQTKTIDINASFDIGIDKGFRLSVLAGETIRLACFVTLFSPQTLG